MAAYQQTTIRIGEDVLVLRARRAVAGTDVGVANRSSRAGGESLLETS